MVSLRSFAPLAFALAICAAPVASEAQSFSSGQRSEIEKIVKEYLLANPEILEEVST